MAKMGYEDVVVWLGSGDVTDDEMRALQDAIMSKSQPEDIISWLQSSDPSDVQIKQFQEAVETLNEPEDPPYWEIEDEPKKIQLGDETIDLIKRGRAQLKQIDQLKVWMAGFAKPALDQAFPDGRTGEDEQAGVGKTMNLLIGILDSEGLTQLGTILTQMDDDFVKDHFDIGWIIDAAGRVLKYQPALRRLTSGFFGRTV
jgi:hypothetical protein